VVAAIDADLPIASPFDDQCDAAIALAAFGIVVRCHGLCFAETMSAHRRRRDALLCEEITHTVGVRRAAG